jgi:hypothetical protein
MRQGECEDFEECGIGAQTAYLKDHVAALE